MNKSIILNDIEQMIKTKYIDPLAKIKFSKLNDHFNNKNILGVYFVFNEKKELIYVGQSGANKNSDSTWGLKNRINQHQSKSDRGAKNFGVKPDYVRDNYFFSYISLTEKKMIKELEIFFIGIFSRVLRFNKNHIIKIFS